MTSNPKYEYVDCAKWFKCAKVRAGLSCEGCNDFQPSAPKVNEDE